MSVSIINRVVACDVLALDELLQEILLSAPQPNEKDPSDVFGAPGGLDPHAKTGRLEGG